MRISVTTKYWTELIIDNVDLWNRGLAGESLNAEETTQFNALARAWELDRYSTWNTQTRLGSGEYAKSFAREAASELHVNPGLLAYWRERIGRGERFLTR